MYHHKYVWYMYTFKNIWIYVYTKEHEIYYQSVA